MRIVVVGGNGFIGNYVVRELAAHHEVIATRRTKRPSDSAGVHWFEVDLSHRPAFNELPDVLDVVVFLAQSRNYRSFPDEVWDIFDVNVQAVAAALEYARRSGARRFIFTSSANVYRRSHAPIAEDGACDGKSFYAGSKRMAELLVESYASYFDAIVLRLFTVYGPGQQGMLIPNLVDRVRRGQPIAIEGRRGMSLTPVFVNDVARVIATISEGHADATGPSVFNLGGPMAASIYDLGALIGNAMEITPTFQFSGESDPPGWQADSRRLLAKLPELSLVSLEEGLDRTVNDAEVSRPSA